MDVKKLIIAAVAAATLLTANAGLVAPTTVPPSPPEPPA
mgnify:CR=1 FL=1